MDLNSFSGKIDNFVYIIGAHERGLSTAMTSGGAKNTYDGRHYISPPEHCYGGGLLYLSIPMTTVNHLRVLPNKS